MSASITDKLKKLTKTNATQFTANIKVVDNGQGSYHIFLGSERGVINDMIRLNKYLSEAGLSPNDRHPSFEHDVVTDNNGGTSLGYGDSKGGFCDKVALSDNIQGTATPDKGFGLHLNFERFGEKEILQKIDEAIRLQEMDHDLKVARTSGEDTHVKRVRGLDEARDHMAAISSFRRRRSEAENIRIVTKFIEDTVHKFAPKATVSVQYDREPNQATEVVYNMHKPQFNITLTLNDPSIDVSHFIEQTNERIREKIPYSPHLPVSGINELNGTVMKGQLQGSADRIAAQIEGVDLSVMKR